MLRKDLFKKAVSMILTAGLGFALFPNVCSASVSRRGLNRGLIRQNSVTIAPKPSSEQDNDQPNNTQQNNSSSNKTDNDGENLLNDNPVKEEQTEEDFQRMIEDILK